MHTVEFDTEIVNGVIKLPKEFEELNNSQVKVILVTQSIQNSESNLDEKTKILDFSNYQIMSFKDVNPVEFQRRIRDAK